MRLKRHPTMKGLVPSPFVPKIKNKERGIEDNEEDFQIEDDHAQDSGILVSTALDFDKLIPNNDNILGSVNDIAEGSLVLGKWKDYESREESDANAQSKKRNI